MLCEFSSTSWSIHCWDFLQAENLNFVISDCLQLFCLCFLTFSIFIWRIGFLVFEFLSLSVLPSSVYFIVCYLISSSIPFISFTASSPKYAISSLILLQNHSFFKTATMTPHFQAFNSWSGLWILWTTNSQCMFGMFTFVISLSENDLLCYTQIFCPHLSFSWILPSIPFLFSIFS